ncbi:MAG TPA: helix-turn-helix transcriptional regulator [bacterium]|nr:helix-turn-helix transcriptional regulator [bacterium]
MGFYQRIGARLRTFRLRAGLSQAALGARLGLTAGAINRYEMGHRRVPLEDVPRIASILGVAPVTLLGAEAAGGRRSRSADRADRVREGSPVYGGRGVRPDAAARAYAKSLTPARLRALAKRAGVELRFEPPALRRYAELIAEDFARRTGRR